MDLPTGQPVPDASPVPQLLRRDLVGRSIRLRTPEPRGDTALLYQATHGSREGEAVWTYMGYGPFTDRGVMADWMTIAAASSDPLWFTVANQYDEPLGMAALMNHEPLHRRMELGHIWYAPKAQRTGANTEAAYLMLLEAFDHYRSRRVEWKCDSHNEASRHAALRLGFSFEGIFRNHMIVKGHNRDTAWFAMTDLEWPKVRESLERWLEHPDPKPRLSAR